jgi:hypothetical protein
MRWDKGGVVWLPRARHLCRPDGARVLLQICKKDWCLEPELRLRLLVARIHQVYLIMPPFYAMRYTRHQPGNRPLGLTHWEGDWGVGDGASSSGCT